LAHIVVMVKQQKSQQPLRHNVQELPKKECDARRKQPIQTDGVTYINQSKNKKMNILFAIDTNTQEVIVSESPKGSNKVNFIERIGRNDNEILYNAVVTLTCITKSPAIDTALFKAMDKVCQMMYNKHKGNV
jgi:hypothetical protein